MKETVEWLFARYQRALQMDATNQILGRDCKNLFEYNEWESAFLGALSANKRKEYDKEWKRCEQELAAGRKFFDFGKK